MTIHLTTRRVAERYGVSIRSIERWGEKAELGFPSPVVINKRKYWTESDLVDWERKRAKAVARGTVAS